MNEANWIAIALVGLIVVAVGTVVLDFARRRRTTQAAKVRSADVERVALEQGGWWVLREDDVYQLASEEEFVAACREGRIYPMDQVFTSKFGRWQKAVEMPVPGLLFTAQSIQHSPPPASGLGCAAAVMLIWLLSAVENLKEPLAAVTDTKIAALVTASAQVAGILAFIYLARRYLPIPSTKRR